MPWTGKVSILTVSDTKQYVIMNIFQRKLCVVPITSGEAGKLCSVIQLCKDDYYRTTNAIQSRKYFTDLSKESDRLERQVRICIRHGADANIIFLCKSLTLNLMIFFISHTWKSFFFFVMSCAQKKSSCKVGRNSKRAKCDLSLLTFLVLLRKS